MTIDQRKLELVLARKCMAASDLHPGVSQQTITKIMRGKDVGTKTVGRICAILDVDPSELV